MSYIASALNLPMIGRPPVEVSTEIMEFFGRILDIDLSTESWEFSPFAEGQFDSCLGGRGFNVQFLYTHLSPDVDPLDAENILVFSCGLLTGTTAPISSRLHVNARSPLTGLLGSSNVGGRFGTALRHRGIQSLIIHGRAKSPVYFLIDGEHIEIRSAKSIWALDTRATRQQLQQSRPGEKLKIIAIGPGSVNGCLFGCIMTDGDHAAGRTGLGTVMGAKNLKAIVIGGQPPKNPYQSRTAGHEAIKQYVSRIKNSAHYRELSTYGGAGYVQWADDLGVLGTRNFRQNHFEATKNIDGRQLISKVKRRHGCPRCPIQCKAELEFSDGKLKGQTVARPEFEPMLSLGARCGLEDLDTLVYLDNLCSSLGIDSISAGAAIAFAMDLYDRGIIGTEDTNGLELCWGNGQAMETLIRQMAYGEGFGAVLAQGVRRAARLIGRGAQRYAAHVKGLELAGYHPGNIMGTALGYAVAARGADFNDVYASMEYNWLPEKAVKEFGTRKAVDLDSIHGKAALVRRAMIVSIVLDCLGLCKVPALSLIGAYDLVGEAQLVTALTGRKVSASRLFEVGERILNLERLFNLEHGAGRADDCLPDMFFEKDYNSGKQPSKPRAWMEPMIQEFYSLMGWDEQGRPTMEKMAQLDILSNSGITNTAA